MGKNRCGCRSRAGALALQLGSLDKEWLLLLGRIEASKPKPPVPTFRPGVAGPLPAALCIPEAASQADLDRAADATCDLLRAAASSAAASAKLGVTHKSNMKKASESRAARLDKTVAGKSTGSSRMAKQPAATCSCKIGKRVEEGQRVVEREAAKLRFYQEELIFGMSMKADFAKWDAAEKEAADARAGAVAAFGRLRALQQGFLARATG